MTWVSFSEELWERLDSVTLLKPTAAHRWAVEQYRKLQRWNEELRAELADARDFADKLRNCYEPDQIFPWDKECLPLGGGEDYTGGNDAR